NVQSAAGCERKCAGFCQPIDGCTHGRDNDSPSRPPGSCPVLQREPDFVLRWKSSERQCETSWLSGLQQRLELPRITSLNEEAVGIVALGQWDPASNDALFPETS